MAPAVDVRTRSPEHREAVVRPQTAGCNFAGKLLCHESSSPPVEPITPINSTDSISKFRGVALHQNREIDLMSLWFRSLWHVDSCQYNVAKSVS